MKILAHITEDNRFVVASDRTGALHKYTRQEIIENNYKIKHINVTNGVLRVNQNLFYRFKSQAIMIVAALAESKKIFGYMIYVPAMNKVVCLSGDSAADLADKYGLVYGKVRSTPSNKKRYIEGNFAIQQGYNHKQVYLNMYKERKEKAERMHRPSEKIVRPDINTIEMRYLPPFTFESYKEPRGVNSFNFKWYKIVEDELTVLKRPQVSNLDISTYCEDIKYDVKLDEKYTQALLKSNCSLGAFAHWGIDKLVLGNSLRAIGQESFYDNHLKEIMIPHNVSVVGKSAFRKNMLETVAFDKGIDLVLGDYAFAENNLTDIYIPNNIIAIGERCFAHNQSLQKVKFESDCKLERLEAGVFEGSSIESITLPASVTSVSKDVFMGCDKLKEVRVSKGSLLDHCEEFKAALSGRGTKLNYI